MSGILSGKDPWPEIGAGVGSGSSGGVGSTPISWIATGLDLFGSKRAPAQNSGGQISSNAQSGTGVFDINNRFAPSYSKPLVDFSKPMHVLIVAAAVLGGIYVYRKKRR